MQKSFPNKYSVTEFFDVESNTELEKLENPELGKKRSAQGLSYNQSLTNQITKK